MKRAANTRGRAATTKVSPSNAEGEPCRGGQAGQLLLFFDRARFDTFRVPADAIIPRENDASPERRFFSSPRAETALTRSFVDETHCSVADHARVREKARTRGERKRAKTKAPCDNGEKKFDE